MIVSRWGNSLAIRLPAELVRSLDLKEGDQVELEASRDRLLVSRRRRPEEILQDLDRFRGRMSGASRLSRDEAHER